MVSADEVNAVGVAEFEADEEGDCFYAKETTVYVVACAVMLVAVDEQGCAMKWR